jgi:hypothetical protein
VKGLEKLTSIRLAEVLSQKSVVPTDAITDALYTQDQFGEAFVDVLVASGHITEWDLAKVVVEHFQLPFVMPSNYDITPEVKKRLPENLLFKHLLVPLDSFDQGLAVVMPILSPFEVLDNVQRTQGVVLFPYVGLISENKKVLQELFPRFKEWQAKQESLRARRRQLMPSADNRNWMNIFDTADRAVRDERE